MDEDQRSVRRPEFLDATDPRRLVNEFLLAIFLPGIATFVVLWTLFRLYLDEVLLSLGFARMRPDPLPFVAIEAGYGRLAPLVLLSAFVLVAYVGIYMRFLRPPLEERGVV